MNHFSRIIDDYYGRPLSDRAEDELSRQLRIQAQIAVLRDLLDAEEGEETLPTRISYDALQAALHDATISEGKLHDIISDADEDAFLVAKYDADEARFEARRAEDGWM